MLCNGQNCGCCDTALKEIHVKKISRKFKYANTQLLKLITSSYKNRQTWSQKKSIWSSDHPYCACHFTNANTIKSSKNIKTKKEKNLIKLSNILQQKFTSQRIPSLQVFFHQTFPWCYSQPSRLKSSLIHYATERRWNIHGVPSKQGSFHASPAVSRENVEEAERGALKGREIKQRIEAVCASTARSRPRLAARALYFWNPPWMRLKRSLDHHGILIRHMERR